MSRFLCSEAARDRHEATTGTASRIDRWLLVEAPGAWGPRALPEARSIDDDLLLALQQRARVAHARTLLVRRPGWSALDGPRRLLVADSRPGHERLLVRRVEDASLAGVELPFEGAAPGWRALPALVAVCTHGRHDACCAVHGRAVVAALARSHPELTWESSHLGGDRFATNALVLPAGHYLGQLPPDDPGRLIDELLAGRRPDPCYRGRSCWATPVQAALALVGAQLGEDRLDALHPQRLERLAATRWRVTLTDRAGQAVSAEVEQRQGPQASLLTCRATAAHPVPSWHLVGVTRPG